MTPIVVVPLMAANLLALALMVRWVRRSPHRVGTRTVTAAVLLLPSMVVTDSLRFVEVVQIAPLTVLAAAEVSIVGLLVGVAALMRSWVELVCETWLVAGCLTLLALLGSSWWHVVPGTVAADVDILLCSLALLVALTVERAALVHVPSGPSRRAVSAFVWVRYAAWVFAGASTCAPAPGLLVVGKVLLCVAYAFSTFLVVRESLHPTVLETRRAPRPTGMMPFALTGVVVAVLVACWLTAPEVSRWSVVVLIAGCAAALLCRQVLTNARLIAIVARSQERERYFRSLVQDSTDVIAICDVDGVLEYVSSSAANVVAGLDPAALVGASATALLGSDEAALHAALGECAATGHALLEGHRDGQVLETSLARRDGEFVLSVRDVTERDDMRTRLYDMAFHDSLTGLANRHKLLLDVDALAGRGEELHALFVDLDRFKHINDASGHRIGDAVLRQVAGRLAQCVGAGDMIARLGGDEFVVVVRGGHEHAARLAATVHRAMSEPFREEGQVYQIGASVGIARAEPGVDADGLLQRADLAMYEAKLAHRPWRFYEPTMTDHVREQAAQDHVLAQEWGRAAIGIHLQPIVSTTTLAVHSTEALLRWQRPDGTVDGPAAALGFAQRTGRLETLTGWILEKVLAEVAASPATTTPIAVNMPPAILAEPAFVAGLAARIAHLGIPPTRINLEITEDAVVEQGKAGARALRALHDEGFHLHIDDFGTGFSSLSYLLRLPVDGLKIDRSFTQEVTSSTAARSVVLGLVSLSRELGIDLIAEGVETREEHEVLQRLGVPYAQGYWYARPEDVRTITDRSTLAGWASGRDGEALASVVGAVVPPGRGDVVVPGASGMIEP